jgi:hypothetical protein
MHIDPAGITLATSHSDRCLRLYDFYTGGVLGKATGAHSHQHLQTPSPSPPCMC